MEIAFNHGIEISAAKEKKLQEYIYRIYSTKVSSDILADLLKPENHMFVPNMNNIDFLKYCLDNALYCVKDDFIYFLKDIYHNDDEAINRILFYINLLEIFVMYVFQILCLYMDSFHEFYLLCVFLASCIHQLL